MPSEIKDSISINHKLVYGHMLFQNEKGKLMTSKIFIFALITIFSINASPAQQANLGSTLPTGLYAEIAHVDSALFNASNNCDSINYRKYFTDDLEFYHDLGGLTVSLKSEMQAFTEMCARGTHIRRELVKGSLEVYPLKHYGAVEIGIHRFYHTNAGQKEKLSGTYKFIHIWQKKDDQWKISRVISYGHDDMKNE